MKRPLIAYVPDKPKKPNHFRQLLKWFLIVSLGLSSARQLLEYTLYTIPPTPNVKNR